MCVDSVCVWCVHGVWLDSVCMWCVHVCARCVYMCILYVCGMFMFVGDVCADTVCVWCMLIVCAFTEVTCAVCVYR